MVYMMGINHTFACLDRDNFAAEKGRRVAEALHTVEATFESKL